MSASTVKLPDPTDLDETWKKLKEGSDHIMTHLQKGMNFDKYMEYYTVIYNYCTLSRMATNGADTLQAATSAARTGANLMGADLYKRLQIYYVELVKQIRQDSEELDGEALLKFYTDQWDKFTTGATYVHRLFTYLNRHWVKREKDEGRKSVHPVYTLALISWKEHFFVVIQKQTKLTQAVLGLIEKQRNGEAIDANLVKRAVDSFVVLGLDETDSNRQNLDVYKEAFETPFLQETERYYQAESEAFIAKSPLTEYMVKAETRLKDEEDRVDMYLHLSTRKLLVTTCETVLVKNHSGLLQEEFKRLLQEEKEEDLSRMYGLLFRIPDGLEPLRVEFEAATKASGLAAIERLADGKPEEAEPRAYVAALLGVHQKYSDLVKNSFRGEPGFNTALDKACQAYVNTNSVTGKSTQKSPELLAKFADQLLKKTNKVGEEIDLDSALVQTMTVFKYIEAKDVFQKFYSKMLARRLVHFLSASEDAEANMISQLKDHCGFDYTARMQRMFSDMALCKDLNDQFKEKMSQTHSSSELSLDFHILTLATGSWPLQAPSTELTIPIELLPTYERFTRYYENKHSGRKLTWLWQLSRLELTTGYTKQRYTLMVSSYQGAILLQFNVGGDSLAYADLKKGTGLDDATLKPTLALFVKQKVLTQDDDTYDLNLEFKSKKIRVNLNAPVKTEPKSDAAEVMKTIDEDRRLLIQAVVVRIMKSRKKCHHQTLVQETLAQLVTRFKPEVRDIKRAIETLMEKEYLQRTPDKRDEYEYLA